MSVKHDASNMMRRTPDWQGLFRLEAWQEARLVEGEETEATVDAVRDAGVLLTLPTVPSPLDVKRLHVCLRITPL